MPGSSDRNEMHPGETPIVDSEIIDVVIGADEERASVRRRQREHAAREPGTVEQEVALADTARYDDDDAIWDEEDESFDEDEPPRK